MKKLLTSFPLNALSVLLLGILGAPFAHATSVPIDQIQGTKSTTAEVVSPLVGQTVNTTGIVTAMTSTGFFIQTPDASIDSNPLTPEGIYVNTGSAPPASVVIGNNLQVSGTVSTVPATTQSHAPGTEITVNPVTGITVVTTNQPLPAPIVIDASKLSSTGSIYQLTPYEGMRVTFASLTAVSGTGGTLDEVNETYTSNGQFYAVLTAASGTTPRPFREPGIDVRDAAVPNAPANVAHFDDNPERILIDSGTLVGSTPINVSTGAVLAGAGGVTGVLDFTASLDSSYTPARLLIDPSYSQSNITPGMTPQSANTASSNTFTVAAFDVQRLFNTSSSDNIYYVPAGVAPNTGANGTTFPSTAVNVTSAAYQRRLAKIALAICNNLHSPDVVALEEVENLSVVTDIATQIKNTCSTAYAAYGTTNTSDSTVFYTQDSTGISVGLLIKTATVDFGGTGQTGQDTTFTPSGTTTPLVLNDRPWFAIQAGIKRANALDYTIAVIVNDMQSMAGENSTTSSAIREKRELQAENIAQVIQNLQSKHFHVISVGDFNAFEFSDGYTDSLATYTNTNVLPATQVVQPGKSGLVTPALTDLTLNIADKTQRWSYVENGNAEVLDHIVVTPELAATTTLNYIHFNADFPVIDYNDATTAARVSDRDVALGFFTIPPPVLLASVAPTNATFPSTIVGASSAGQVFTISNTGEASFTINSITTSGDFAQTNTCGTLPATVAPGASCTATVVFTPTVAGARTGNFSVVTSVNTGALTAPLTGTGAASDFTLADSAGHTTTTVTVSAGSSGSAALVFTPLNGFNASITTTCTAQGTAPAGVTCTAPAAFTLSGTAAVNKTVSFTTTARTSAGGFALDSIPRSPWTATAILSLLGLIMFLAGRTRRLARIAGLLTLLLALFLPAIGCGGSGSGGGGGGGGNTGTPAGTYTYNVTATAGAISHTETVTLVVQ